jgi:hypothetical protein
LVANREAVRKHWSFFARLLGAAFSLWRAVFLANPARKWDNVYEQAVSFFRTLIEDNIINYPQDKNMSAYSVGYYVNNAKHRLEGIWNEIPTTYQSVARRRLQKLRENDIDERSPPEYWDLLFEALCLAFLYFKSELSKS